MKRQSSGIIYIIPLFFKNFKLEGFHSKTTREMIFNISNLVLPDSLTFNQGWKEYFTFWDHKEKLKIFCNNQVNYTWIL